MYHYDKLIIGGSLAAYACSFVNSIPVIHLSTIDYRPFPWEHFPSNIDWTRFGFPNQDMGLITNDGVYSRGLQRLLFYIRFSSIVGLSGLAPFAGNIERMEVDREKKKIILSLNGNRTALLSYNKLYIFDSAGISWDLTPAKKNEYYVVTDWFGVHKSMRHSFDVIFDKNDDPFVWRILYYISDRCDGVMKSIKWLEYIHPTSRHSTIVKRDFCTVSFLREEQLIEYDSNNARIKAARMLKEEGVKGTYKHTWTRLDGNKTRIYGPCEFSFDEREIKPLVADLFENVEDIKFLYWDDAHLAKFITRYVNHTNLTENINRRLYGDQLEIYATDKSRVQKVEYAWLSSRRHYSGRCLPVVPCAVGRFLDAHSPRIFSD